MTERLSLQDCLDLYDQDIAAGSLVRRDVLESAMHAPFSGFGDVEAFPTLAQKAARLAFGIAEAQAFTDGNKRLAWEATLVFLDINGAGLDLDHDRAADLIWGIGEKSVTLEDLTAAFSECLFFNET